MSAALDDPKERLAMQTIRVLEKTDKDGTLRLRIPLGKPEAEYEIVVILQPRAALPKDATPEERGWPPGYFDLAGSIDDEAFQRAPQGEIPKPLDLNDVSP